MIKRIILAIVAGVAIVAFGASGASATTIPRAEIGPFNVATLNGNNYCAYGSGGSQAGGTPIVQGSGNCTDLYEALLGYDRNGYAEMYLRTTNGNFMAANNACDGVTIKTSEGSDGVVWILYTYPNPGGGEWDYLTSRYCGGNYSMAMGGTNTAGAQWEIGSTLDGPLYTKITIMGS